LGHPKQKGPVHFFKCFSLGVKAFLWKKEWLTTEKVNVGNPDQGRGDALRGKRGGGTYPRGSKSKKERPSWWLEESKAQQGDDREGVGEPGWGEENRAGLANPGGKVASMGGGKKLKPNKERKRGGISKKIRNNIGKGPRSPREKNLLCAE